VANKIAIPRENLERIFAKILRERRKTSHIILKFFAIIFRRKGIFLMPPRGKFLQI
jgi:hypothetical protein